MPASPDGSIWVLSPVGRLTLDALQNTAICAGPGGQYGGADDPLADVPDVRTCRMAGWVSACGQRAGGYGKILIERRVDDRGHDMSCWLGMPGP